MALLAAGSLQNVYTSLDAYCTANLLFADGTPLTVRLHGVRRFVPPVDDPWIEVHYDFLGLQSDYRRQMGTIDNVSIHSTERQGHLQLNIYQRARVFATRYTTAAARDLVVAAFPEGHLVSIYDYASINVVGDPQEVGLLVLDGIQEHVTDTGLRSGVTQHVVAVQTRYLEPFTRP